MSNTSDKTPISLPPPRPDQVYVSISALEAGYLTLPEKLFITDADPEKRTTVPSLSFLIRHPSQNAQNAQSKTKPTTNLVFDLGLKRDLTKYPPAMASHIGNRQPISVTPDAAQSLRAGGLDPERDIDYVILSHVHWDHVGTPDDFPGSKFVVGSGTLHLLKHGAPPHYPAEIFDENLLPRDRTQELPPPPPTPSSSSSSPAHPSSPNQTQHTWHPLPPFSSAIDFFSDGSLYIIDAPGHLYGHVNLLARVGPGRWVYLGGDCCHDTRILRGEKGIALYEDGHGGLRSVHVDTEGARGTVERVGELLGIGKGKGDAEADTVEVVVAHDREWAEGNRHRFLPGTL